ncbi:hypothetical protein SUZIE_184700 [Sciurus carolinensis]|uniref:Uncharacterized protein n=1 Tax=Sciurus carolinensis TaxID=30640 RepID=A0AA41N8U4_SCICA|nr:hypothetical protein [Sciurus carolinensis]
MPHRPELVFLTTVAITENWAQLVGNTTEHAHCPLSVVDPDDSDMIRGKPQLPGILQIQGKGQLLNNLETECSPNTDE